MPNIGLEEPSTITARVATRTIDRGGTTEHQEIMVLGDPNSSLGLARILDSDPASTVFGLAVREVNRSISSVAGKVAVVNSSAADLVMRPVFASTATDNPVSASQAGTWTVRSNLSSTAADNPVSAAQSGSWTVRANLSSTTADNPVRAVLSSTSADNPVTATQTGTWTVNVGTHIQSSVAPSSGSSGLIVRQVVDAIQTFASTSALASTTVAVTSSAASIRAYVTAYSITSTNQTPAHWGFYSSNGTLLWPLTLAALSSGVAGANLAVAAPGYLFRTEAAAALNFKTAGSTVSGVQLGVSYFLAP